MDKELVVRAKSGDMMAREELISSFDGMIRSIAASYAGKLDGAESLDDLVQVGRVGFLEALDRFDFAIAPAFIPYVKEGVKMAIRDHLNSSMRLIRLPRCAIERVKTLSDALSHLADEGREISAEAVKERTGFSDRILRNAERSRALQMPLSLDFQYSGRGCDLASAVAADHSVEDEAENDMMVEKLSDTMKGLSGPDRFIINSLYGSFGAEKLSARDIARRLSLSENAVRRRAARIESSLYRKIS